MTEQFTPATEMVDGTTEHEQLTIDQPVELPADHPLVKTLAAQKAQLKDLKEFKAKAARLDELEAAAKTEAERMADRIAKAEAETATLPSKVAAALRAHLVMLHQIDEGDAELFLTSEDPDVLLKQVTRFIETGKQKQQPKPNAAQGSSEAVNGSGDWLRDQFTAR